MYRFLTLTMMGLALSFSAYAFEPFRVQDIRVEGLQRISPGTGAGRQRAGKAGNLQY
jgi:outer membrane protein assembly factor BamA